MSRESHWCIFNCMWCTASRLKTDQFSALDRPRLDLIPHSIQNSSLMPSWNSIIKPIRTCVQPSSKFCTIIAHDWPLWSKSHDLCIIMIVEVECTKFNISLHGTRLSQVSTIGVTMHSGVFCMTVPKPEIKMYASTRPTFWCWWDVCRNWPELQKLPGSSEHTSYSIMTHSIHIHSHTTHHRLIQDVWPVTMTI